MADLSRRSLLAGTAATLAAAACTAAPRQRRSGVRVPFDREAFLADVRAALPQGQAAVDEVIARAVSDPASVPLGLGPPQAMAIEVLHRDPELSIFNIVWPPHAVLVPHDHLMWASIGVYAGREDNILWEAEGSALRASGAASVSAGEVFSLPADAIHSVTNPVEAYTAALHVYGGDLSATTRSQWDPLTLDREPFDLEDGRRILQQADRRARM